MAASFQDLLDGLDQLGFVVLHREESQAVVAVPDSGAKFALLAAGDWLQVGAELVASEKLAAAKSPDAVRETALRVHKRYLGCRLGYDEDDAIMIQRDLYPGTRDPDHLAEVISQMAYVGAMLYPLMERVLETGIACSEDDIDEAFDAVDEDDTFEIVDEELS